MLIDEEILYTHIGYAAGLATILTFVFQILRIIQTKNVNNLSSYMYTIYSLSLVCWFAYGVYIESWILVISNFVTFICTFAILLLIIYFDTEDKIERERRDTITSVYNLKYFSEAVSQNITQALITNRKFAILLFKITNMESLETSYGSKTSKQVLKTVAKFLDKELRSGDLVARYDEENFIIYIDDTDDKGAKVVSSRLLQNVKNLSLKGPKKTVININAAIGGCTSKQAQSLPLLTQNAEKALQSISPKSKTKTKFYTGK